jgi:hypothetical protein
MKLKNILLKEEFQAPSEQILKGAVKEFKKATGINVKDPALTKSRPNYAEYTISMLNEIDSPLMQHVFTDLYIKITVEAVKNVIGGYMFDFSSVWTDVQGNTDTKNFGPVFYINGKYTSRIR